MNHIFFYNNIIKKRKRWEIIFDAMDVVLSLTYPFAMNCIFDCHHGFAFQGAGPSTN
ncbi:Uncharacterised protein [Staphylococcus intermedius NCTC 11048]|uniref:Uncharacterized protein n=1 Tax=Staphylococcus intermedius NCTC 11048 TaxID=1141106 RepID=A0A380G4R7_STAIN|nr:Uncharacterised protein [Staphylococcus intermedius NCTC 11048]